MPPMRECAGSIAHVPGSGSSVVPTVRVAVSAILEPPGLGTGLIPVLPLTTVAYTTIFPSCQQNALGLGSRNRRGGGRIRSGLKRAQRLGTKSVLQSALSAIDYLPALQVAGVGGANPAPDARGIVARATVVLWGREPTKRRPSARGLEGLFERLPGPD